MSPRKGSLDAFITASKGKVTVKEIKGESFSGSDVQCTGSSLAKEKDESGEHGMKRAREADKATPRTRQRKGDE